MTDLISYLKSGNTAICTSMTKSDEFVQGANCALNGIGLRIDSDPGLLFGNRWYWVGVAALAFGVGYYVGKK